jgi:5'-3' exonuclease
MGIPSYFSYIIKNHKGIFKNKLKIPNIDNFYLDSNSIIYDSMREIKVYKTLNEYESKLIHRVIETINDLISYINPQKKTFITFDGVAPFAKIKQQKTRRFKTSYVKKLTAHLLETNIGESEGVSDGIKIPVWDKTAITPGTKFMENLSNKIKEEYKNNKLVMVSCPDEIGEGEHKIFNYIRANERLHKNDKTVVYGLDADLIMLCLNNLDYCDNLFICREAPEFIKSLNYELNPNELYFLDIKNFKSALTSELTKKTKPNKNIIHDYTFICFLLGNDFMPHFPSLNIRTNGIHILMSAYHNCISSKNKNIINDKKNIQWGVFKHLIKWLAENEEINIQGEKVIRDKIERKYLLNPNNRKVNNADMSELDIEVGKIQKKIENIPLLLRDTETLIDPYRNGWEKRYYKYLFNSDNTEAFVKEVCINYLEGLEWVMSYYTSECIDWGWKYKYNYPPLFKDLLKYIPFCEVSMVGKNDNKPLPAIAQLAYVIPKGSFHLVSPEISEMLHEKYGELYNEDIDIKWSYCRYFWEAHPEFADIEIDKFINDILNLNNVH